MPDQQPQRIGYQAAGPIVNTYIIMQLLRQLQLLLKFTAKSFLLYFQIDTTVQQYISSFKYLCDDIPATCHAAVGALNNDYNCINGLSSEDAGTICSGTCRTIVLNYANYCYIQVRLQNNAHQLYIVRDYCKKVQVYKQLVYIQNITASCIILEYIQLYIHNSYIQLCVVTIQPCILYWAVQCMLHICIATCMLWPY